MQNRGFEELLDWSGGKTLNQTGDTSTCSQQFDRVIPLNRRDLVEPIRFLPARLRAPAVCRLNRRDGQGDTYPRAGAARPFFCCVRQMTSVDFPFLRLAGFFHAQLGIRFRALRCGD